MERPGRDQLADLIEHVGVMGQLREAAGALKGGAADAVRGALRGLAAAHAWAAALKIPAEVLVDLSEDAINRLRTLPPWLQERLSQLNVPGLRHVLGCASPCLVNLKEVVAWLTNLAADGARTGDRMTAGMTPSPWLALDQHTHFVVGWMRQHERLVGQRQEGNELIATRIV